MARAYLPLLLFLASLWGASYMFIKVAVADIEPATMTALRLLLAASVLFAVLSARSGVRRAADDVRRTGGGGVVLGLVNGALPFTLIAWGEKHIDSGVAAIANSSVPIFVALLALRFVPSERIRGARLFGVLLGLAGVGILVGVRPEGGWWAVAGVLAVVVASLSYACANLFTQHRFSDESPLVVATAATVYGGLALLPFGLLQLPTSLPGWKALASVAALGILGTAVASLVLYRMLVTFGAARTTLVTYLIPPVALVYGVVLLGETVTASAVAGLALILTGVALGSGLVGVRRGREPAAATPSA